MKPSQRDTALEVPNEKLEATNEVYYEKKKSLTESFSSNSTDEAQGYYTDLDWTPEEEKKVLFIIDTRLMPFFLLMTFALNMDRTNISNAISDNLPADLGFDMTGVNTGTLIHSIVFTIVTLFTNAIVKRVGAHVWIPILMFSWAIVTWAHALIHNLSGFLAVRFFISFTEAGFIPACLVYLTGWYKTKELASRLSWFWALQNFASAFSGLISFGIFRLSGVGGLYGWKWLFIVDGIFTHIVGFVAIFYIPSSPFNTTGFFRGGKSGWFTERQSQIAIARVIRDDATKVNQKDKVTWHDVKISLLDTRLWTHMLICFSSMLPTYPVGTYLPTLIKSYGFPVTTSNLLTVPSFIIGLIASMIIAHHADRYGYYAIHALVGPIWSLIGFLVLELLKDNAGAWNFYGAALFLASSPSWHGMHIAWMSSNLAPIGKRTLALGAIIGAANIAGIPGSQIYQQSDSPRFFRGNWINFAICCATILLVLFQHFRYLLTNRHRERKWNAMTDSEKNEYLKTTKAEGNDRLDFRFRL